MKKRNGICALLSSALCFCAVFATIETENTYTARAEGVREEIVYDTFDDEKISESDWDASSQATLHRQYTAMRFSEWDLWGSHVACSGYQIGVDPETGEKTSVGSVTDVSFVIRGAEGVQSSWLGLIVGAKKLHANYDVENANYFVKFGANDAALLDMSAKSVDSLFSSESPIASAKKQGEAVKIFMTLTKTEENSSGEGEYEIAVKYASVDENGETGAARTLFQSNNSKLNFDGYLSFCGMGGISVDICSFAIAVDGEEAFADDFTQAKIGFNGTDGANWTSHAYSSAYVTIGKINTVTLNANDSLVSKARIIHNQTTERQFEIGFDCYAENSRAGDFIGVYFDYNGVKYFVGAGIGLANENVAILMKGGKPLKTIEVGGGFLNTSTKNEITLTGDFDYTVTLNVNGKSASFSDVAFDGAWAIGSLRTTAAQTENYYEIDNARYVKYTYKISSAGSYSTDFGGVKKSESEGMTFYEHYVNESRWNLGSEVIVPKYRQNGKWQYIRLSSGTNLSKSAAYFAPKEKYGEYIIRFDFSVNNDYVAEEHATWSDGDSGKLTNRGQDYDAKFGLSFGKTSLKGDVKESDGIFFYNHYTTQNRGEGVYHDTRLAVMETDGEYGFASCPYDVFAQTDKTFNVMIVVRNSTLELYMKESSEGEEKFNTPIYTRKGVNGYGFPVLTALDFADVNVYSYSIVNISPTE